jgi:hypothetical protein
VLVLSGDRDIRTPTASAVAIAAQFPQGHVLVVPGSGHSVLDRSPCAQQAVRGWLTGGTPPAVCARIHLGVPPLGAWRGSVAATPPAARVPAPASRTVAAFVQTLHDAEDLWLLTRQSDTTVDGLVGGTATPDAQGHIRLHAFSSVAGLTLTGSLTLKLDQFGQPVVPLTAASGTITAAGSGAAHGVLRLAGNRLTGSLGGRRITFAF